MVSRNGGWTKVTHGRRARDLTLYVTTVTCRTKLPSRLKVNTPTLAVREDESRGLGSELRRPNVYD